MRLVLLASVLCVASRSPEEACADLSRAWADVARKGLDYYAEADSKGIKITISRDLRSKASSDAVTAAAAQYREFLEDFGNFDETCASSDAETHVQTAAKLCRRFFLLLFKPRSQARRLLEEGKVLDDGLVEFMSAATPWSLLLHSGWPVFPLAALVESELREDTRVSLAVSRLGWKEPSENCNEEQEAVRLAASLYVGEGRTVKLTHIIDFFHQEVGDADLVGEEFITAVARAKPRHPGVCPAALGVAYAALADALQCHWRRPTSAIMHQLIDIAVEKAQGGALRTFGEAAESFNALASSRWPLLPLLSRLQPRSAPTSTGVLVSWSSREAELGGLNWAKNFAQEVFSFHDFVLEEDVDCADIFVYRSSLPANFGGVLIFVDGEGSPADSLQEELLQSYPASIVVGPLPAGGDSVFFPVPYASTSFASRSVATPSGLLLPRPVELEDRPGFAAYLVYKCYPHRERFFRLLDARGREAGLGPVETLSRCGDAGEIDRTSQRYAETYMDDAADLFRRFRFALVFENKIQTRYVTEKIVNAFVAGAVPIYWGSDFVAEIFNTDAMIWVNSFESFEAAVEHVIRVASEPELYAAYASAPPIRNTSAGRWYFSWHRDAPSLDGEAPTLREELAAAAMKMHVAGLDGSLQAVERRPFDYAETFPS